MWFHVIHVSFSENYSDENRLVAAWAQGCGEGTDCKGAWGLGDSGYGTTDTCQNPSNHTLEGVNVTGCK